MRGASVSWLESLNEAVDGRADELHQIHQGATDAADNLTKAQASPDLQDSLNRRPALELMWVVGARNDTPEQRRGLHKLLRSLRLALVLDDSDPAAHRVGMGCDCEVWDWQPFLGAAESARLIVEGLVLGPMKEHMPPSPDSSGLRIDPGANHSLQEWLVISTIRVSPRPRDRGRFDPGAGPPGPDDVANFLLAGPAISRSCDGGVSFCSCCATNPAVGWFRQPLLSCQ